MECTRQKASISSSTFPEFATDKYVRKNDELPEFHCIYRNTKLSICSSYWKRNMTGWKNVVSVQEKFFEQTTAQDRKGEN